MKTKTIDLYEFDELSDDAKAKVLENERDINVDYGWSKWSLEEWEQKLEAMGFEDPEIHYSGFWSQGDGASFTSKSVDVAKFIASQKAKGRFKAILKGLKADKIEVNAEVYRIDHHYSHEYTVKATVEVLQDSISDKVFNNEFHNNVMSEGDELAVFITDTVRILSRKIYKDLESEYDGLTSDEAVISTIEAKEYTFTASGKMENA